MKQFIHIKDAMSSKYAGKSVSIRGFIHRKREGKTVIFLIVRDVSGLIQATVKDTSKAFRDAQEISIESSLELTGKIHKDKRAPGGFEISPDSIKIIGLAETFPIARDLSEEFLLDVRHLWLRSRKLTAAMKVRSAVFGAIHDFYRKHGFYEVQAPSLTPTSCEGGSSQFEVKYFDEKVYLSQSWQLYAEAMVSPLEKIYCVAPSFRAEKSHTSRHLTEYWHAEMELIWAGLDDITRYGEEMVAFLCKRVAEQCPDELKQFGRDPKDLLKIKAPFQKITYDKAVEILHKDGVKFIWGKDLRTLEERALMKHYSKPLIITHYPKKVMAFYKTRDSKKPETARCFDMLAPEFGFELIGGSERDPSIEEMKKSLKEQGEKVETYDWYFDTRKYGVVPHAGFGFGIERFIQWVCKLEHIRDTIPFPRTITRTRP